MEERFCRARAILFHATPYKRIQQIQLNRMIQTNMAADSGKLYKYSWSRIHEKFSLNSRVRHHIKRCYFQQINAKKT